MSIGVFSFLHKPLTPTSSAPSRMPLCCASMCVTLCLTGRSDDANCVLIGFVSLQPWRFLLCEPLTATDERDGGLACAYMCESRVQIMFE